MRSFAGAMAGVLMLTACSFGGPSAHDHARDGCETFGRARAYEEPTIAAVGDMADQATVVADHLAQAAARDDAYRQLSLAATAFEAAADRWLQVVTREGTDIDSWDVVTLDDVAATRRTLRELEGQIEGHCRFVEAG